MAHLHPVYDTDPHFSIDSTTRGITYESKEKLVIVQGDHNSQRYTFELPRYIDGHDMMLCDLVQVHYINIESGGRGRGTGVYKVTDMQLATDDQNTVVLSWLVSQNATKYVGSLNFVLRFACTSGSKIDYAWSTTVYSAVAIITSIDNADLVVEQYADVLEQWYMDLTMAGVSSVDTIYAARDAAVEKAKTDINTAKTAAIQAVQETDPDDDFVKRVADKIPVYGEDGEILGYEVYKTITVTDTGTGTNSLVGNDSESNQAISENASAFGTNIVAGLKGYYWSSINILTKTITLATTHSGGSSVTCEYGIGDVISIVNDAKYDKCSKITAVSGSTITVDSLPFTSVVNVTNPNFDDYSVYCPAKPTIGLASFGKAAFAIGDGCIAGNYATFTAGRDNDAYGQYSAAVGRQNEVGYGGFSYGRKNTNDGLYNIVGGVSNKTSNTNSVAVFGGTNTLRNSDASLVGGSAHSVDSSFNSIVGGYHNGAYYAQRATITGENNYVTNSSYGMVIGNQNNAINGGAEDSIVGAKSSHITNSNNSLIVGGYENTVDGTTSGSESAIISSRKSKITNSWNSTIIGGEKNKINGGSGNHISGGSNNTIDGNAYSSNIIGNKNFCSAVASVLIGEGLKNTNTNGQIALGKYNAQTSALFVIGNGISDTSRKNIITISPSGDLKIGGSLTLNMNGTPVTLTAEQLTKLLALIK